MKTLPLRDLLRQPAKVKKLTAAGHDVHITDRGRPLWRIQADQPAPPEGASEFYKNDEEFWRELEEMPLSNAPSFLKVLLDSRQ